jgi:hypothetical protein
MSSIDPQHFENHLKTICDKTWNVGQVIRTFNEAWADINGYWDDKAAHYIRDRYVSVIQNDDIELRQALATAMEHSKYASANFYELRDRFNTAYQYSCDAEVPADAAKDDLRSIDHAVSVAENYRSEIISYMQKAENQLSNARGRITPMS